MGTGASASPLCYLSWLLGIWSSLTEFPGDAGGPHNGFGCSLRLITHYVSIQSLEHIDYSMLSDDILVCSDLHVHSAPHCSVSDTDHKAFFCNSDVITVSTYNLNHSSNADHL